MRATSSAVSAARGISIIVPMRMSSLPVYFLAFLTFDRLLGQVTQRGKLRLAVPTSGIMISGLASIFFFLQLIAASTIAVTCISRISG